MKKLFFIGLATLAVSSATLTSCGKYEEGPGLALSSKTARLTGSWKLTAQTTNGVADALTGLTQTMEITKDGKYSVLISYSYMGFNYTNDFTGTWAFSDDKLNLITTVDGLTGSDSQEILRLAGKELKLKSVDGSETVI
ncbi:MAG: lipocalin family protein, partial [Flavobacteriia bacterium]